MNTLGVSLEAEDRPGLLRDIAAAIAEAGGNIQEILLKSGPVARVSLEVAGISGDPTANLSQIPGVISVDTVSSSAAVFGKRVIVIGGGAQIAQVVLGAVGEADRHNLRGERISVDTIPLVVEHELADAVRAVARLPRVKILVLAGSLMGGEVTRAVQELLATTEIPVISLNMAGSVRDHVDLVVSDPVQAGVMAVMAIAETAKFDLARLRGQKF